MRTSPAMRGYPRRSGYPVDVLGFYVEPRWVTELLLSVEDFDGEVLDPCCGIGTIVSVCRDHGLSARGSDSADRGFGEVANLFSLRQPVDNIISNVPYALAEQCARQMLALAQRKVALILPLTFWESQRRERFFQLFPPIRFWACGERPSMPPGCTTGVRDRHGAVQQMPGRGGKAPYGWFVWERDFLGVTSAARLPSRKLLTSTQGGGTPQTTHNTDCDRDHAGRASSTCLDHCTPAWKAMPDGNKNTLE